MAKLERHLGRTLFQRGPSGYALTADGRSLAQEITGLDDTVRRVAQWQKDVDGPVPVRITAGFWTSRAIAYGLPPGRVRPWQPHFVAATAALDLARREADIGIRNEEPCHPWLARQPLGSVDYAVFGKPGATGFVATPPDVPSQRWLHENHAPEITTIANDPRLCLDLAMAGHGRILLPTFTGDTIKTLERMSDPVAELHHEAWLVTHQDARNDPPIRAAIDEIAAIFR
jgi:DNA-binding transcriptional LysR family regulator